MDKRILTLIFVSVRVLCSSEESPLDVEKRHSESIQCFSHGAIRLFSHEPTAAMENFEKARHLAGSTDSVLAFCFTFVEAVALDCLGQQEQCALSIQSFT